MIDKIKQAKCRNLLKDYEDLLKSIIDEEETRLFKGFVLGDSEFEILKNTLFNAGVREGMRRILAKLNEYARG